METGTTLRIIQLRMSLGFSRVERMRRRQEDGARLVVTGRLWAVGGTGSGTYQWRHPFAYGETPEVTFKAATGG